MGTRRVTDRLRGGLRRRGAAHRLVVTVGLAGFVVGVYVVVVLGGGGLAGRTDSPSLPLSVLATTAVALLFAPVQAALERLADRMGHPASPTPYDVLSRFSGAVSAGPSADDVPLRICEVLARGTGARWAQVWLDVAGRLTLRATWPADAHPAGAPPTASDAHTESARGGRRTLVVRHGDEVLGVLRLQERPGTRLTAVEERLFAGLAAQAGLVLRLVALRAELQQRHDELAARADDLRASRARIVVTQDDARRRLERDIHDGAQQHLVALAVNLRLAQTIAARAPGRAVEILAEQVDAALVAIDTLSSLSRGIYPRVLAAEGLPAALRSASAAGPLLVTVTTDATDATGATDRSGRPGPSDERPPAAVEAALYFASMEAVQNAAKHSGARAVSVHVGAEPNRWLLTVVDDGAGFDPAGAVDSGTGTGLANMHDRLDAVGGTLAVASRRGAGTTVTAVVPRAAGRPGLTPLAAHEPVA